MVDHHHHTEETVIFPGIEALAAKPGLLSGPAHQHEEFHGGLVKLREYAERVENTPEEYRWEDMKGMIDGFADKLVEHLREEVDVFLGFEGMGLDSAGLRKTWDEAERVAKANGEIALLVSIMTWTLCYEFIRSWVTDVIPSMTSFRAFWDAVTRLMKAAMNFRRSQE